MADDLHASSNPFQLGHQESSHKESIPIYEQQTQITSDMKASSAKQMLARRVSPDSRLWKCLKCHDIVEARCYGFNNQ